MENTSAMEARRMFEIIGFASLWLLFFVIGVIKWIETIPATLGQLFGLGTGIILGILFCVYLKRAWDPTNLRPTNPDVQPASTKGCLMPLSVGGGILTTNIASKFLNADLNAILFWCIGMLLIIGIGYMLIQVVLHRPRQ